MDQVQRYLELIQLAQGIGAGLVTIIKGYAHRDLTPADYDVLQAKWDALEQRTAKNAGLIP